MIRVLLATLLLGSYAQADEALCLQHTEQILDRIGCLENVAKVTEQKKLGTLRQFEIEYTQYADHNDPSRGTFNQRLVLLHRSDIEPMVLQTSGYMIYRIAETAIAKMFKTNQLQVEHRFFANSVPEGTDWTLLDIKQSADDFHRITVDFKKIYTKRWVNTGASKGGMTSSYHRFFYPDDLDGTVADVAPLSFSRTDQRYNTFIRNVGGDTYKKCRADLAHFQKHMLKHRKKYMYRFTGEYTHLDGKQMAYEHAVLEHPFYFWQYGNPESPNSGCKAIPDHHDDDAMFGFLQTHARLSNFTDRTIQRFMPYFYQAATQLGGPDNVTDHLEPYRLFEFGLELYTPKGVELPYDNSMMRAVSNWVKTDAENMIFIYGTYDPWTAAEYDIGKNDKVAKFYVPGGNHGVNFTDLHGENRKWAIWEIAEWLQKDPVVIETQGHIFESPAKTLHQLEFEAKRELGIR